MVNFCKWCGVKWRTNYPFGRMGGSVTSFSRQHQSNCRYAKKEDNQGKNKRKVDEKVKRRARIFRRNR